MGTVNILKLNVDHRPPHLGEVPDFVPNLIPD